MRPEDIFDETISALINEAMSDGQITEEEFSVIELVSQEVTEYVELLEEYREDGMISKEEGKKLSEKKRILVEKLQQIDTGELGNENVTALVNKLNHIVSSRYRKY